MADSPENPEQPFTCGPDCTLKEEIVKGFDTDQFSEITDLLAKHGIDEDLAEDVPGAQQLLFEHLLQKKKLLAGEENEESSLRGNVIENAVEQYQIQRQTLLTVVETFYSYAQEMPKTNYKELKRYFPKLETIFKRMLSELADPQCSFIVAGETGSGKSHFINLLTGHLDDEEFLPVSNCPSTSCLCLIRYGEPGKSTLKAYRPDAKKPEKVEQLTKKNMSTLLSTYTHQKTHRDDILYTRVEVECDLPWLKSGLTLVDSPGAGERAEITALVKEMMPKAFGFIYVVNTTKAGGIQTGELQDLLLKPNENLSEDMDEAFESFDPKTAIFIFNKWDLVDQREKTMIKDFVINKLGKEFSKEIDIDSQVFFLSTTQAQEALKKGYETEEYKKVVQGIEGLLQVSLKSKVKKYHSYLTEVLKKCILIFKTFLESYDSFIEKYKLATEKITHLQKVHGELEAELRHTLDTETKHIGSSLTKYISSEETKEKLCKWEECDCPVEKEKWEQLSRESKALAQDKITNEIKQWHQKNQVFQNANDRLLAVFQERFHGMTADLNCIESDLVAHKSDDDGEQDQMQWLMFQVDPAVHKTTKSGRQLGTGGKVAVGVVASIFMPVTLVVAPFFLARKINSALKAKKKKRTTMEYYTSYIGNETKLPELMAAETEACLDHIMEGNTLKLAIEEKVQQLGKTFLHLLQSIPHYVNADMALLNDRLKEYKEGVREENQMCCQEMMVKALKIQHELDYFHFRFLFEQEIKPKTLILQEEIGEGSFGSIWSATWKNDNVESEVLVKKLPVSLSLRTASNASAIRIEDNRLRMIQCDNVIVYHGLCMKPVMDNDVEKLVPLMVMESSKTTLDRFMIDRDVYLPPGMYRSGQRKHQDSLLKMADLAIQLATGLHTIHSKGFLHRKLKPSCISVHTVITSEGIEKHTVKICDFILSYKDTHYHNSVTNMNHYNAPENSKIKFVKQGDIYSYGILLLELYHGKYLSDIEDIDTDSCPVCFNGSGPFGLNEPPEEWDDLLRSCWSRDSGSRPSAKECVEVFQHYIDSNSNVSKDEDNNSFGQMRSRRQQTIIGGNFRMS